MRQELLDALRVITPEEQEILGGDPSIHRDLYTSRREFVVDSDKLLSKGKLIEIRPHTRFAHFPVHRHNYVELVYMCAGTTTHIINQKEQIVLREGDLLFLNQNVYHEILPAGEGDIAVNFIILPDFFKQPVSMIERENVLRDFLISAISGERTISDYLHIQAKGIVPVENLMENMIWTLIHRLPGTNSINQTSMGLLLMNLSRFADTINRTDPGQEEQNLVFSVLNYIDTRYRSGTLAEVSAELGQPTYAVSRLLKKHMGSNFRELLQSRKLQQAAYLLDNTALSVDAIMERVGYDNSSYFYRKFRERYGCSPREYRKQR
ncbi:MAG: AraC family transcriptional regulator [Clostridiales bacterium]|nr:AraC family transcriptional regulator [Clostridiales bacterium]